MEVNNLKFYKVASSPFEGKLVFYVWEQEIPYHGIAYLDNMYCTYKIEIPNTASGECYSYDRILVITEKELSILMLTFNSNGVTFRDSSTDGVYILENEYYYKAMNRDFKLIRAV